MAARYEIFQESLIGGRKSNQDRVGYACANDTLLMIVADGMGGHLNGEIAAEIAVRVLIERFNREARIVLTSPAEFLRGALEAAHLAIGEYTRRHKLAEYPRTTCVACVVKQNIAYWCHAGDSRLYLLRNGRLYKRTSDHSRVQRMIDAGLIREEQALTHPDRNKIYSCLGGDQLPAISMSDGTALKDGDIILLCSDGLWGMLTSAEFEAAIAQESLKLALPKLIRKSNDLAAGQGDNLSVIALQWPGSVEKLEYIDSAVTMPAHFLTRPVGVPENRDNADDISDEEIERAIVEIQLAIQKLSK
ncbi:MAG: protein phosphatase 2C domain-containing protein [Pseudomonadota bacterium]|nr:protein phosphatase 2C domain-containing protein [Pseudomonadota bacterium]